MDFSALKKKSNTSNLEKLVKASEAATSTNSRSDDSNEYWKCELDKSGNGYAVIRFLENAPQDGEDTIPWVKYYDHGFQGPGGWYIEKSLTSIGSEDPVSKYNSELWDTGIESNKEIARKQKRRLHYVSNIYVVKDSKNPDNEGKVFKFTYGKKIFEKITQAMNPQFEDDEKINPFDLWNGANFKLKIRKVDGYQNYDLAEFDSSSPLAETDAEIEAIWKKQYSLKDIIDAKSFKSYAELESRLKKVLGQNSQTKYKTAEDYTAKSMDNIEDETFLKQATKSITPKATESVKSSVTEDDDDMSYFDSLIGDD